MDNADILKSLNSKLVKEAKESRQQVDSLTTQLNVSTKRVALLELEKDLVYDFVYVLVDQMREVDGRKFYWDWAAMVDKIDELQIEMVRVLKEKSNVEEERGKNEAEIGSWNSRLNTIIRGIVRGKHVFTRVCNERDKIKAQLDARVNEAEKREADLVEPKGTVDELKWDIEKTGVGGLVQEKKKMQEIVKRLTDEKELAVKEMEEAFQMLDECYEEKKKIENAKIQRENDIVMLKEHLGILKDIILSLEKSSICQNDKIKQLEAEVSDLQK